MKLVKRLLNSILPEDTEPGCGWGPFKLSGDHPFTPACNLHDIDFDDANAGINERSLDEADWLLFWRMALIAKSQERPEDRCALALELCLMWPLARGFGGILWDGDRKKFVAIPKEMESSTSSETPTETSKNILPPPE